MTSISASLYSLDNLKDVAGHEGFVEAVIKCHGKIDSGEGFTGDIFLVTITDNKRDARLELVVKQSTSAQHVRNTFPIRFLYQNECYFYERIWPKFLTLQRAYLQSQLFDNVANCYATDVQEDKESLILENLKSQNFVTLDKRQYFNAEHVEYVFQKYGQFHALSFIYKEHHSKEFRTLHEPLKPTWLLASQVPIFQFYVTKAIKQALTGFEAKKDAKIIEKIRFYVQEVNKVFHDSLNYKEQHGVILHGDCWSNNLMFKYNRTGQIEDMKLIDFQTSGLGSVVYDLSYFLYSGGSKESFDKLEDYLKIYHRSLTKTCFSFNCNQFISFKKLQEEWKSYCKFGFILALLLLKDKLTKKNVTVSKFVRDKKYQKVNMGQSDAEIFKRRSKELIYHMIEANFL